MRRGRHSRGLLKTTIFVLHNKLKASYVLCSVAKKLILLRGCPFEKGVHFLWLDLVTCTLLLPL